MSQNALLIGRIDSKVSISVVKSADTAAADANLSVLYLNFNAEKAESMQLMP
jgi:hypothetical protein